MIFERTLLAAAAVAATAAAVAVAVVSAAFAVYALLKPNLGPAGAAACVAAIFALLAIAGALIAGMRAKAQHHPKVGGHEMGPGLTERLLEVVREKPVTSAAAAIAAGVLAMRNPQLVGVVLSAFLGSKTKGSN